MEFTNPNFEKEVEIIHTQLHALKKQGKKIVATSSFQTQSLPLLHILSCLDFKIPIAFIDTRYLFPETYRFKDDLAEKLDLDIINVQSNLTMIDQLSSDNRFLFSVSPDKCCQINKVEPLNTFLGNYDIWISGVRADQSSVRNGLQEFQVNKDGVTRYHPMLSWSSKMVYLYRKQFGLPEHPLEAHGYLSIGCMPCTAKYIDSVGQERAGRWQGMNKEECGLHTSLA